MGRKFLLIVLLLSACTLPQNPNDLTDIAPTETSILAEWVSIAPGLQSRTENYTSRLGTQIYTLQIDPSQYDFRMHYTAGQAFHTTEWVDQLSNAEVILNANFYTEDNSILGLLIADGIRYGAAYVNRGGIFGVLNDVPTMRSTRFNASLDEPFSQLVQAFPMLIVDGVQAYTSTANEQIARRTAIGMDTTGNVLFFVTTGFGLTLQEFSQYLAESDLNLMNVLNLDGGGSSMIYVNASSYRLLSFDPVPAVLAVYAK